MHYPLRKHSQTQQILALEMTSSGALGRAPCPSCSGCARITPWKWSGLCGGMKVLYPVLYFWYHTITTYTLHQHCLLSYGDFASQLFIKGGVNLSLTGVLNSIIARKIALDTTKYPYTTDDQSLLWRGQFTTLKFNSLAKWYIIILSYQVYQFTLYLSWTTIEPITTQTNGALVHSSSSMNQLLLYDIITLLAN